VGKNWNEKKNNGVTKDVKGGPAMLANLGRR
jgi:hypothetical protein